MQILLVEDDVIIAMGYEAVLRDRGDTVCGPAATARAALDVASGVAPLHLALVDINLGDGPWAGIGLARALHDRWGVPSLFVTGQGPEVIHEREAAIGLIQKPCDPAALVECISIVEAALTGKPLPTELPYGLHLFR